MQNTIVVIPAFARVFPYHDLGERVPRQGEGAGLSLGLFLRVPRADEKQNRLYAMFACANLYSLAIAGRKLSTD